MQHTVLALELDLRFYCYLCTNKTFQNLTSLCACVIWLQWKLVHTNFVRRHHRLDGFQSIRIRVVKMSRDLCFGHVLRLHRKLLQ